MFGSLPQEEPWETTRGDSEQRGRRRREKHWDLRQFVDIGLGFERAMR